MGPIVIYNILEEFRDTILDGLPFTNVERVDVERGIDKIKQYFVGQFTDIQTIFADKNIKGLKRYIDKYCLWKTQKTFSKKYKTQSALQR